jgi:hemerythrin-like domain-containing protein
VPIVCEYCGCQSLEVIAELTDEHDRLRDLGRALTEAGQADDRSTAAAVAAHMLAVLGPHTAVEEGGLFPALADDFPRQMRDLSDDHKRIETALGRIAAGVGDDWAAVVAVAVTNLFEHILKEQDGVFPAALSTLTPTQWDEVAAARRRAVAPHPGIGAGGSHTEIGQTLPAAGLPVTRSS